MKRAHVDRSLRIVLQKSEYSAAGKTNSPLDIKKYEY
jgi:hypothetical protein